MHVFKGLNSFTTNTMTKELSDCTSKMHLQGVEAHSTSATEDAPKASSLSKRKEEETNSHISLIILCNIGLLILITSNHYAGNSHFIISTLGFISLVETPLQQFCCIFYSWLHLIGRNSSAALLLHFLSLNYLNRLLLFSS